MKDNKNDLLTGSILPALMTFALPILFSLLLQALYGAVDLWMVSRFSTNGDISAVATGSQTMMIATGIVTGLAMGITVLLGQAMGEKNERQSARIIGTSVWIFSVLALVFLVVLLAFAPQLAAALNAPAAAHGKTIAYIRICGAGVLFIVAFNVLNGIFCGLGDSKTPLLFVLVACVVNIAGDYVLIALWNMGAAGAAIATVLAQAVSVVLSLCMIRKKLPFAMGVQDMRFQSRLALQIVRLGSPIALQNMCNELSYLIIIGLVNELGEVASSGVGIAEKLVMFIMLIPTAYMSAISAFVAQNVGAQQLRRARASMWNGMATAACIGGVMAYLCLFHGNSMAHIFIDDPEVAAAAAEFLKATAIECFLLSITYCFTGYFNGVGKTGFVMVQGLCAVLLVRIPYAVYASRRPEPTLLNIGMSMAFAAMFMLIVCGGYYFLQTRKEARTRA